VLQQHAGCLFVLAQLDHSVIQHLNENEAVTRFMILDMKYSRFVKKEKKGL